MISLTLAHVRRSVTGSCASAFQKLFTQSVLRVAMMSSYTARTSGDASRYSISPKVAMLGAPQIISRGQNHGRDQNRNQEWKHPPGGAGLVRFLRRILHRVGPNRVGFPRRPRFAFIRVHWRPRRL